MKKSTKISILVSEFPPTGIGGAEIATYHIATILAKRKFEVHVITRNVKLIKNGKKRSLKKFEEYNGFFIHRIPCAGTSLFRWITHVLLSLKKLIQIKPEIIHGQMITPNGLIAVIGAKLLRKRSIVYSRGTQIYNSGTLYLRSLGQFTISQADVVLGLSNDLTRRMKRIWAGKPIFTLTNGIELMKYYHKPTSNKVIELICVGRLVKNKRVSDAIKALAHVKKNFPAIKLTVIGSGPQEDFLKKLCITFHVQDRVNFLGAIAPRIIPEYLSRADAFIFPSLWESFGLAILEAMASSLPVLAARTTAVPELVQDQGNGLLHTPGNVKELTANLELLLQNDSLRQSMGRKSREIAEGYSWEKIVDNLLMYYFNK